MNKKKPKVLQRIEAVDKVAGAFSGEGTVEVGPELDVSVGHP